MVEQWKIQRDRRKAGRCGGCDQPLGLQQHMAILHLPECLREDLCELCFAELSRKTEELPFHWKVMRKASGKTEPALDLQGLRVLFDRLGEVEDAPAPDPEDGEAARLQPERAASLRYLVALLLLRKRMLKMADARNEAEEAADLLVFDPKVEGMEPVALTAPELDGEGMDELREELLAMAGLAEPQAAESDSASAT